MTPSPEKSSQPFWGLFSKKSSQPFWGLFSKKSKCIIIIVFFTNLNYSMSFASALGAYTGTVEGTLVLSATFTAATIAGTQSLYLPGLTAPATNPVALTVSYGRINVLPTTDDGNLIVGLVGNCIITPINTAAQVAPLPVAALAAEANALVLVPGSANGLYRIQIFA